MSSMTINRIGARSARTNAIALAVVGLLSLVACSGTKTDSKPYADDFRVALSQATSDFERGILEDGEITREEYVEAHDLWLSCMEETYPPGEPYLVRLEANASGLFSYAIDIPAGLGDDFDSDLYDKVTTECSLGTIGLIAVLYNGVTNNPQKLPIEQRMATCLVESGAVPDTYTPEDFAREYLSEGGQGSLPADNSDLQNCWMEMSGA